MPSRFTQRPSRSILFVTFGLFLCIFSIRLQLIEIAANSIPFWDQWDAEARELIVPYLDHGAWFTALFQTHNEHRIVFTKALALGLLNVNGQWDPLPTLVVNAALLSALFACLYGLLAPTMKRGPQLIWATFLLALGCLPYGRENTLWAFQNQIYFVLAWGGGALYLAIRYPESKLGWIGSTLCAVASAFSMSSGFLLAIPFGLCSWLAFASLRKRPMAWFWGISSLVLISLALVTRHHNPDHDVLRPSDYGTLMAATTRLLAWPLAPGWLWFIPLNLPLGFLSWRRLIRGAAIGRIGNLSLLVGAWGLATAGAISFGRGATLASAHESLPGRYADLLLLLPIANLLAIFVLLRAQHCRPLRLGGALWMAMMTVGFLGAGSREFTYINRFGDSARMASASELASILHDQNLARLDTLPAGLRTHPRAQVLKDLFSNPDFCQVLPPALQKPLIDSWMNQPHGIPQGLALPTCPPFYSNLRPDNTVSLGKTTTPAFISPLGGVMVELFATPTTSGTLTFRSTDGVWEKAFCLDDLPVRQWVPFYVTSPKKPLVIIIEPSAPQALLLSTAPRPIGCLAIQAHRLIEIAMPLLMIGACLMGLGWAFPPPRRYLTE